MADLMKQHKEYVESGRWKCNKSPAGAHHWVEHQTGEPYICKWCFDVRRFPRTFDGILKVTYGKKQPFTHLIIDEGPTPRVQQRIPMRKGKGKRKGLL